MKKTSTDSDNPTNANQWLGKVDGKKPGRFPRQTQKTRGGALGHAMRHRGFDGGYAQAVGTGTSPTNPMAHAARADFDKAGMDLQE